MSSELSVLFPHFENLAFNNPYYSIKNDTLVIANRFDNALNRFNGCVELNPVAAIEVFNKNHAFSDRTIIQHIHKTPWLPKPSEDIKSWKFASKPLHGHHKDNPFKIAKHFFILLCDEILGYAGNHKEIGVLLSGGMDSRMAAGVIDYLVKKGEITDNIYAYTWGMPDSRDVRYAEKIAEKLGWKWTHLEVRAADLIANVHETAMHGCEYSPMHLHAIPQVREITTADVIIAGSYGDSIGRAEYGGIHVTKLPPINAGFHNVGNLIHPEIYKQTLPLIQTDIDYYHQLFPAKELYMQNEFDYQLHYMRRQLNPCMELLTEKTQFYQLFTHPDTFRYMWSIDTDLRNDELYKHMLSFFPTDLSNIPWARTGLRYGISSGKADNLSKRHHRYKEILQFEILSDLKNLTLNKKFKELGIFYYNAVEKLYQLIEKYPMNNFYYTEKLAWLASVSILVNEKNIGFSEERMPPVSDTYKTSKEYFKKYMRNKTGGLLRKIKLLK